MGSTDISKLLVSLAIRVGIFGLISKVLGSKQTKPTRQAGAGKLLTKKR